MKILETNFFKSQWRFTQHNRVGNIAIFQRQKNLSPHFEVVRVRSHNGLKLPNGETTAPSEYYPSDNAWGRDGFTFMDLASACEKAAAMLLQECKRESKESTHPLTP